MPSSQQRSTHAHVHGLFCCEPQIMREILAHAGLLTCSRAERLVASDVPRTAKKRAIAVRPSLRITVCTHFTTSQWSCELPLMSHQFSSSFFFSFTLRSGTWPFCDDNPGSGGSAVRVTSGRAPSPRADEPFSSDVATTMASSVKMAADRMNVRSMSPALPALAHPAAADRPRRTLARSYSHLLRDVGLATLA